VPNIKTIYHHSVFVERKEIGKENSGIPETEVLAGRSSDCNFCRDSARAVSREEGRKGCPSLISSGIFLRWSAYQWSGYRECSTSDREYSISGRDMDFIFISGL